MIAPVFNPYLDLHELLRHERPELQLAARKKLIWAYAWAIPGAAALAAIRRYTPIVEWGAGTGYWAWVLRQAGARVRAFDREPAPAPRWHPVEPAAPEQLDELGDHALFLCWPPLGDPMAEEALARYPGRVALYAGEWEGRTGSAEFHKRLSRGWKLLERVELPRWPGFGDELRVYERLPGAPS